MFKLVTYAELINVLQSYGQYLIFIGSISCENSQAVMRFINEEAVKNGADTVYMWDPKLDGMSDSLSAMNESNDYAGMYVEVLKYLGKNFWSQINTDSGIYFPIGGEEESYYTICAPILLLYDKDNYLNGKHSPVTAMFESELVWNITAVNSSIAPGGQPAPLVKLKLDTLFAELRFDAGADGK